MVYLSFTVYRICEEEYCYLRWICWRISAGPGILNETWIYCIATDISSLHSNIFPYFGITAIQLWNMMYCQKQSVQWTFAELLFWTYFS